ncbi:BON domain-containing protein [Alishewanella longhuensis]
MMNIYGRKLLLITVISLALGTTACYAAENVQKTDSATAVSNARQEAQIWTTYALSPYLRANTLSVSVAAGKATLTGHVAEDVHKELAGEIAAGVTGIDKVDNQIVVDADHKAKPDAGKRSYGEVIDDASITAAVKSKLLWSKHTEGMDTKVVTNSGKVQLTGTVASEQAKQQAEKLAKNTEGVRSVANLLEVTERSSTDADTGSVIADSWITTKVKSTYMYSSNVASSDISVTTNAGVVTLTGKVESGVEQALAVELAQNIRGVKSVLSDKLTF